MSANDKIILDKILEQRRLEESPELAVSKYFEIFAANEILKDLDLSYEELMSGIVDGGGDGGIDSAFVFVNGELLTDDSEFTGLRKNISIELVFIQSKTSEGFSEKATDKFQSATEDLLDLGRSLDSVATVYNQPLRDIVKRFRDAYGTLASRLPNLQISYYYVSRGNEVHPNVSRKVERLEARIKSLFSAVKFRFQFVTASKLLGLVRRQPTTTHPLAVADTPISSKGAFVCLVGLKEFWKFVTDEVGGLRRVLFESNVRDYQGATQVNDEIQETLETGGVEDFWWLNNGVTILASSATLSGKTLTLEDPQVVNGLQTSTEIYKYFKAKPALSDDRNVLVRVVVPGSTESQDRIIKATNSQTRIPDASLRATEKIHRDIEQFFKSHNLYYDRRKNYYKNEGKPIERIISIPYLAQAVMAIALRRPDTARARPSSLLKSTDDYRQVFSEEHPIQLYAICVSLMKAVDAYLRRDAVNLDRKDQTNLRFYVAMLLARRLTAQVQPTAKAIAAIEPGKITETDLQECVTEVDASYRKLGGSDQVAKGPELLKSLIAHASSATG